VDWGERFHGSDSSVLGSTAYKACCQCGIDLNHRTRFKDSQDRYWCPECNAADRARHQPALCEDCQIAFPRDLMKQDRDKFICPECLEKRLLRSSEPVQAKNAVPVPAPAIGAMAPARSAPVSAPASGSDTKTALLVAGLVAAGVGVLAIAYLLLF
jgi:uncharacterized paraquat-inducible protein A